MTDDPGRFRHVPPDRAALWARLRLTGGQLAALCGVSLRQVDYWTRHGYLPAAPGDSPRYDGAAVELCLLIGQAHRAGLPVRRAIALARETLAREASGEAAGDTAAALSLDEARARLRQAEAGVADTLRTIEPLLGHGTQPTRSTR
jgi:DNA-binding transcriptional MerR regulator